MIPPALNWVLRGQGLQDLPHKTRTVFPLLCPTMVTHGPVPGHLPPALLVKTVLGGAWEFVLILKGRSIFSDLTGIFLPFGG